MTRSMTRMASIIVLQDTVGVHGVPTDGGRYVKTRRDHGTNVGLTFLFDRNEGVVRIHQRPSTN